MARPIDAFDAFHSHERQRKKRRYDRGEDLDTRLQDGFDMMEEDDAVIRGEHNLNLTSWDEFE